MPSKKTPTKLGDLFKQASDRASARRASARAEPPSMTVKSISLTPAASVVLDRLMRELSKETGRKVSASAVVRALLRCAETQGLADKLTALVRSETNTGEVVWGK